MPTLHTDRRTPLRAEPLEDRIAPSAGNLLQTLANPDPAAGDQFGTAVATDAQYIVVGNPFDDVGGFTDAGSVSVYNRATGQLVRNISNPAPGAGDPRAGTGGRPRLDPRDPQQPGRSVPGSRSNGR